MKGILIRRRAAASAARRVFGLPTREQLFTSQKFGLPSYADLLSLHHVVSQPIQDFATGQFNFMIDYDPVDSAPIG